MSTTTTTPTLTRKDFATDQDVRWCPGCGDYSILAQVQNVFPTLGIPREKFVVVSGIGCSSRFPYYMNTYGFHSIHGRAPTLATGLKVSRPDLSVWVITGDGDGLSIGGNHFLHVLRRNLDIKILLFNNQIYGLTKGQYSPTSEQGKITKSTPMGAPDQPIWPLSVSLAAEATFVARSVDVDAKHLQMVLKRAAQHKGTAFVEIYQNCNIFNDGAFAGLTEKETKADSTVALEHGKPLIFGKDRNKGIRIKGLAPEVVEIGKDGITEADLLVHDESVENPTLAYMLTRMRRPHFPVPLGVFRNVDKPTYDGVVHDQEEAARAKQGNGDLAALLRGPESWVVE
ncbi:MAG TPA: 2-oxoacid:ferredoxin oxidoreductase subunit beta [Candidatus Xenobia bacterium]|jgi:2-oxoglutarate ferredoxin oxidoreductase subunit beta